MYHDGNGVQQDYAKAIFYYEKASELGFSDAMVNLAFMYYTATGVPKDYNKAVEYLKKAVAAGNQKAAMILAQIS